MSLKVVAGGAPSDAPSDMYLEATKQLNGKLVFVLRHLY